MRPPRQFTGYLSKNFPAPLWKFDLETSGSIKSELFASIELYSEVGSYGRELLKNRGHLKPSVALRQFRAYIRQARAFYEAADLLNFQTSPLLYYYSFMNFAKAFILLKTPGFVDDGLHHGISYKPNKMALKSQFIRVRNGGIFPEFYRYVVGSTIQNGGKLSIKSVLGYCSDVGFEFTQLRFGQPRFFPCKFVVCVNQPQNLSHAMVAINFGHNPSGFEIVKRKALAAFEEIDLDVARAKMLFDYTAEDKPGVKFFESKKVYPHVNGQMPVQIIVQELAREFDGSISFDPFSNNTLFMSCPRFRRHGVRCFMEPEVGYGETEVYTRVQA